MRSPRVVALALVALAACTFCTTKDVDVAEEDLPGPFADSGTATATSTATTGSGGTGSGPSCNGTVCTPATVEEALILDFEGDSNGAAGASGGLASFERPEYLRGIFKYPSEFDESYEDGAWHLSGNAGQGSGFGLEFACATDASAFSGIEFTIRGDTGMQQINVVIETAGNISDACKRGTCAGGCIGAAAAVNHMPGERTWSFSWEDFQDGSPDDTPDPSEITAIRWEFQASSPIPVDFYIDDIRFIE